MLSIYPQVPVLTTLGWGTNKKPESSMIHSPHVNCNVQREIGVTCRNTYKPITRISSPEQIWTEWCSHDLPTAWGSLQHHGLLRHQPEPDGAGQPSLQAKRWANSYRSDLKQMFPMWEWNTPTNQNSNHKRYRNWCACREWSKPSNSWSVTLCSIVAIILGWNRKWHLAGLIWFAVQLQGMTDLDEIWGMHGSFYGYVKGTNPPLKKLLNVPKIVQNVW